MTDAKQTMKNPWELKTAAEYENVLQRYSTGPLGEGHLDVAPAPKGDPRFHALLREMGELHDKKQAD